MTKVIRAHKEDNISLQRRLWTMMMKALKKGDTKFA
jgi:hypothetical protein